MVHRVRRIITPLIVFDELAQRIYPEAIDTMVEPEAQHVKHSGLHLRMAPVEIGLFLEVSVIVILLGCRTPFPGAAAKHTAPVVGRPTIRRWVVPQIPITLRVLPRGPRGHEPGMLL